MGGDVVSAAAVKPCNEGPHMKPCLVCTVETEAIPTPFPFSCPFFHSLPPSAPWGHVSFSFLFSFFLSQCHSFHLALLALQELPKQLRFITCSKIEQKL